MKTTAPGEPDAELAAFIARVLDWLRAAPEADFPARVEQARRRVLSHPDLTHEGGRMEALREIEEARRARTQTVTQTDTLRP